MCLSALQQLASAFCSVVALLENPGSDDPLDQVELTP